MLIKALELQNYYSFRGSCTLDCSHAVTVIAGRNNTGKSNILRSILLLAQLSNDSASNVLNRLGWQTLTFGKQGGPIRITAELDVQFAQEIIENDFVPSAFSLSLMVKTGEINEAKMVLSFGGEDGEIETSQLGGGVSRGPLVLQTDPLRRMLSNIFILRAERHVHLPNLDARGTNDLAPDGTNVLQVLNSLSSSHPDTFVEIVSQAKNLLPGVSDILAPLRADGPQVFAEVRESGMGLARFSWSEVASGTRHLLALLTLLYSTPERSILLVEEPESFLHPQATVDLFGLFKECARTRNKQIIMTTHSPLLMELAGPSLNVVVRDQASGVSDIIRPSPAAQKALTERGIVKSFMLSPFQPGFFPAGLLILEGDDDIMVWDQWLAAAGLSKRGVVAVKGGHGEGDAIKLALYLQHLQDSGIRSAPFFLVVDSDGDAGTKRQRITDGGLREGHFHVLEKKELEDYLLDAQAIAEEFGVDQDMVNSAITDAKPGKEGLRSVIEVLSKERGLRKSEPVDATLKGRIASHVAPHSDLVVVLDHLREALA